MTTIARVSDGTVMQVGNSVGAAHFVPHKDVLEAFSQCEFASAFKANEWLKRFRNVGTPMSRMMLIRAMKKENGAH